MEILHLIPGQAPVRLDKLERLPETGMLWIDFARPEAQDWPSQIQPLISAEIDDEHLADSLNDRHPPFFDGTSDYDMLIFEGLGPTDEVFPLDTRVGTLFLFDRLLVSIRESDAPSYATVKQRLRTGRLKCGVSPVQLAQFILDAMVDRWLRVREILDHRLTEMQDELLDPANRRNDWRALLTGRRIVRRLESLSEAQHEALDAWRRGSRFDWNQAEEVRLRDISEHTRRITEHASNLERDVEAAVELHFATVSHRTNRIMRTLTVISAIFFPLNFITSLYGMNFDHMPELHWYWGYYAVLALLTLVAGSLLLLFSRRGYF
jgi:magnesium transporter